MKRAWSVGLTVIACALTISLAAQTPAAQDPPSPGAPSQPASSDKDKVTVTGCLERASASESPTGTSGSAAAAGAKFTLKNVSSSPAAPGTAGTSGMATASSYTLDGEDSKLTPHVGHKVEITGKVEQRAASDKPAEPGATASAAAPKLKVDNVKMIAASCTP